MSVITVIVEHASFVISAQLKYMLKHEYDKRYCDKGEYGKQNVVNANMANANMINTNVAKMINGSMIKANR